MQEHSYTLPMCSIGHTSHVPSSIGNLSIDIHSSSNESESGNETSTSTSTPELNLLLDKLTEILRFRSGCRRHFGVIQQQQQSSPSPSETSEISSSNLKRLQSGSIEPLHTTSDISSFTLNGSMISTGAWKSSNIHHKQLNSTRLSHHHHHHKHHLNISTNLNNLEKKRRLPCLLQRLIDEGNLIKEAVRRLKSQRFSHTFKQQINVVNTPSTPTTKSSSIQPITNLTSRLTPSSSTILNINNDSPIQTTSSPNRSISWFLSSSVFGVNASTTTTTNHSSGSGSPLRTCFTSTTPMEIGIHDG